MPEERINLIFNLVFADHSKVLIVKEEMRTIGYIKIDEIIIRNFTHHIVSRRELKDSFGSIDHYDERRCQKVSKRAQHHESGHEQCGEERHDPSYETTKFFRSTIKYIF